MTNLTYTPEYEASISPGLTILTLWLPQSEHGVTLTLTPDEVQLMKDNPAEFCKRFMYPALTQLSQ